MIMLGESDCSPVTISKLQLLRWYWGHALVDEDLLSDVDREAIEIRSKSA